MKEVTKQIIYIQKGEGETEKKKGRECFLTSERRKREKLGGRGGVKNKEKREGNL